MNCTTEKQNCQEKKILQKIQIKKSYNKNVINWLCDVGETKTALKIKDCATFIGITNIDNIAHIVKADFCRQRICNICAWRRQAKFIAQMQPVLNNISNNYDFLFVTLTVKNTPYDGLKKAVDDMLIAYNKFLQLRKIKRVFKGVVRSLEITYNHEENTFHPHIHLLIAVEHDYFANDTKYITHTELTNMWQDSLKYDYAPICDIRKVNDTQAAECETLKYALKPSKHSQALSAFYYILKGRRLVSFSGIFAQQRKALKLSDFESVLTDDLPKTAKQHITYNLYKFDSTGGIYTFYDNYELRS